MASSRTCRFGSRPFVLTASCSPPIPMPTEFAKTTEITSTPGPLEAKQPQPERGRAPLTQHLDELRWRLWVVVAAVALTSTASFAWAGRLIEWLKRPAGASLDRLAFFSPADGILAYMKVAVTAGLFLAMPVVLYQLWAFVRPALTRQETRYGLAFVWWGSLLFLAGGVFAYAVLLPVSLPFLLEFGAEHFEPVISVNRYLSFTVAEIGRASCRERV